MKLWMILLTFVFAGAAFAGQTTPACNSDQDKKAATDEVKETRWQGDIVRINKDQSSLSVRGGQSNMESAERMISYDGSTQWTKPGKPAEQSDSKRAPL